MKQGNAQRAVEIETLISDIHKNLRILQMSIAWTWEKTSTEIKVYRGSGSCHTIDITAFNISDKILNITKTSLEKEEINLLAELKEL